MKTINNDMFMIIDEIVGENGVLTKAKIRCDKCCHFIDESSINYQVVNNGFTSEYQNVCSDCMKNAKGE